MPAPLACCFQENMVLTVITSIDNSSDTFTVMIKNL